MRKLIIDNLQQWAMELLAYDTTPNPFSTNDTTVDASNLQNTFSLAPTFDPLQSPLCRRPALHTDPLHRPLLLHYQDCLSRLVACNPNDPTNGFDAFTTLASTASATSSGKAQYLGILAWAGRHMTNQGQSQYEALSERVAKEAADLLFRSGQGLDQSLDPAPYATKLEKLSTVGALLMLMSFKVRDTSRKWLYYIKISN